MWDAFRYHPTPVIVSGLLGLAAGVGAAALVPSSDSASATVLLRPLAGNPYSSDAARDPLVSLETEAQLVRSDAVSLLVIEDLDLGTAPADMRRNLVTNVPSNTQVLEITYTTSDDDAAEIAQAYADQYLLFRLDRGEASREERLASLDAQIENRQADLAEVDDEQGSQSATVSLLALQAERDALARDTLDPGEVIVPAREPAAGLGMLSILLPVLGLLVGVGLGLALAVARERSRGVLRHLEDLGEDIDVVSVLSAGEKGSPQLSHEQALAVRALANVVQSGSSDRGAVALVPVGDVSDTVVLAQHTAHALTIVGAPAVAMDATGLSTDDDPLAGAHAQHLRARVEQMTTGASSAQSPAADPQARIVVAGIKGGSILSADALIDLAGTAVLVVELGRTRQQEIDRAVTAARYMRAAVLGVVALEPGAMPLPPAPGTDAPHAEVAATSSASAVQADEVSPASGSPR